MKTIGSILAAASLIGFGPPVNANISLSLQPGTPVLNVGESTPVDLVVSGLGDFVPPSVGAFLVDLAFDANLLSALSVSFGSYLDLGNFGSSQFSDLNTSGAAHADELSFNDSGDLNDMQPSSFTLATFTFQGLAAGVGTIDFLSAQLGDELGESLEDISVASATIQILGPQIVPDGSSTASLLSFGILSLVPFAKARARRNSGKRLNPPLVFVRTTIPG